MYGRGLYRCWKNSQQNLTKNCIENISIGAKYKQTFYFNRIFQGSLEFRRI